MKLDHLAPSHHTHSHGQSQKDYGYGSKSGLRHQRSSDSMSLGAFTIPMFVPNVHIENAASTGPSYPCQRKTSSAEDMMMRKNSSAGVP